MPFVQQKAEQSTSSVSSFTTTAMTVTGGNAIVACMGSNGGILTSLNASDSKANSYTNGVSTLFNTNGNVAIGVARAIAGGSTTFTVTPNAARFVSISAQEYSNLGASNEATNGSSATASSAVNPGAVNPASANDLYVSCWTHDGSVNQTFTFNVSGEGWNPRADLENTTNQPLGSQDLISSGSRTGSATLSASARWEAAVATFQTVAAAAAVAPLMQPLLMTLGQRGKSAKPWALQSFLPSPPPYVPPVAPTIAPLIARFEQRFGRQQMGRVLPKESSPRQAYVLNAEVGSYVVTGQAATVRATRLLNASPGSYVVTGQAASLRAARLLNASPGVYVVTGQAASALAARLLNATAGSYAVTGQAATLLRAALLGATPGVYVVSGANALLTQAGGGGPIPVPDQFAVLIPGTDPGAAPRVGNLSQLSDRDFQALAYLSTLDPYLDDVEQFISQVEQDGDEYDDLTSDDFYDSDLSGKVQWRKPRRQ